MEAVLQERRENGKVLCTACARLCLIGSGQSGFCGIRKNIEGSLHLLTYGRPFGMGVDPIEKKPVLHMYPGYRVLSFGTTGCNFACQYCQNYDMSQRKEVLGDRMSPQEIVDTAIELNCQGIAYTYNEPTVFMEFAHDVGVIARERGLVNIFVTNGYETRAAIDYARDFLDIMTVDFKGNANNSFYRRYISVTGADPIFDTIRYANDVGIHVEITDLVVPQIGDNLEDARTMLKRLTEVTDADTPVSFLRFHPDYRMMYLDPTPVKTLEIHRELAISEGFRYSYIGNIPGHPYENTYCPSCGSEIVSRVGFHSRVIGINSDGACSQCGFHIAITL